MKRTLAGLSVLCLGAATLFPSCSSNKRGVSDKTGFQYNDRRTGGFENPDFKGQTTGPGLAFVEGGRFVMGSVEENLDGSQSFPRTASVPSFYMDETEVANIHYREYVYWLSRAYSADYPNVVRASLPDSTVWRRTFAYYEPLVTNYFHYAGFNYYPVVGVNWVQANEYARWRSDRVNELILIKNGKLKYNANQVGEDVYNNDAYQSGQYEGLTGGNQQRDFDPNGSGRRSVRPEDGLLLPNYRLPTEAEWEYAALANIGNNPEPETRRRRGESVVATRNVYPWGGGDGTRQGLRNSQQGEFQANFKQGKGDMMGVAAGLNDNAFYTAPVYSYKANSFGLYNMAGNVNEWVLDTYRPELPDQGDGADGDNVFRGNTYEAFLYNSDNELEEKDSLGNVPRRYLSNAEIEANPSNRLTGIKTFDDRGRRDGDTVLQGGDQRFTYNSSDPNNPTSLITDDLKVIKGGSWNDRAYWLVPGTRRFMDRRQAASTVGFRCVMDRFGSPDGRNSEQAGNYFSNKGRRGR